MMLYQAFFSSSKAKTALIPDIRDCIKSYAYLKLILCEKVVFVFKSFAFSSYFFLTM